MNIILFHTDFTSLLGSFTSLEGMSIFLVLSGIAFLVLSLFPARDICDTKNQIQAGWKFLGGLIMLFIFGYGLYAQMLFNGPGSPLKLVVSLILFGGGIFVISVVRLSLVSIKRIEVMAEQRRYQTLHDGLTGLANKAMLEECLDEAVKSAKAKHLPITILIMDLARFKEINDSLGHFYGDYLLQEVTDRLREVERSGFTLARFGGDEFALVMPGVGAELAGQVCLDIATAIDRPFMIEGHKINVALRLGVALFPEHGRDSGTLLQHAEVAMYEAKRNDVDHAFFSPAKSRTTWNRLVLVGELRDAMNKDQFFLQYQPKVSAKDGKLVGVEALVRWRHRDRGLVSPAEFVPLAEKAGLYQHLSRWVLDNALEQSAKWQKAGLNIPMAINLSLKNLHDLGFAEQVRDLLCKWDVDPSNLTLEVTESAMMVDPQRVDGVVASLRDQGLSLAIDDFGTGYSSIAYLRNFSAKEIKIDKSFVIDMLHNEDNAVIVKSTIDLVHSIGCTVVAEGVEDEETMLHLDSFGCDYLQGYHICRPLSDLDLQQWLVANPWRLPC